MRALPALAAALLLAAAPAFSAAKAEQFTLFIYESPADLAARTDPARAPAYWAAYGEFAGAMQQAGILRGGMALHGDAQGSVYTSRDGKPATAGGARAKAPDQLGGFFMIEVPDRAAALAWAAKAPRAATGAVEVRPAFPAPAMR